MTLVTAVPSTYTMGNFRLPGDGTWEVDNFATTNDVMYVRGYMGQQLITDIVLIETMRGFMEFSWPDPYDITAGALVNPPVFTSAQLEIDIIVASWTHDPKIDVYIPDDPTPEPWLTDDAVTEFPSFPGPDFPAVDSLGRSWPTGSPTTTFLKLTSTPARVLNVGTMVIPLSVANINSIIRDDGGTNAWDGKFHLLLVESEELTEPQFRTWEVVTIPTVGGAARPILTLGMGTTGAGTRQMRRMSTNRGGRRRRCR